MILKKYFYTVTVSDNYWKVLFFYLSYFSFIKVG